MVVTTHQPVFLPWPGFFYKALRRPLRRRASLPQSLGTRRIRLALMKSRPPVYPRLWGDFRCNLSTLDLLLNCGTKARDIIAGGS
jgi:hypothetical protein